MRIKIENRQRRFRIVRPAFKRVAAALVAQASAQSASPWREVTFILLDDAAIAPINRAIMRHEGSTDVITQRYMTLPGESDGVMGEIFINVERAWQAGTSRQGRSPHGELALYAAHGCDHLNDEDDATPAQRQRMRRREHRWLSKIRIPRLLSPA